MASIHAKAVQVCYEAECHVPKAYSKASDTHIQPTATGCKLYIRIEERPTERGKAWKALISEQAGISPDSDAPMGFRAAARHWRTGNPSPYRLEGYDFLNEKGDGRTIQTLKRGLRGFIIGRFGENLARTGRELQLQDDDSGILRG